MVVVEMYCREQITIPEQLPLILKKYAKGKVGALFRDFRELKFRNPFSRYSHSTIRHPTMVGCVLSMSGIGAISSDKVAI